MPKECEKYQVTSSYLELKAAFPEIWSQDIRIQAISRQQHLNFEIEILLARDHTKMIAFKFKEV